MGQPNWTLCGNSGHLSLFLSPLLPLPVYLAPLLSLSLPQSPIKPQHNSTSNESYYDITCSKHMITSFIIPQILLLCAFVYGLYIFRRAQTEHLSTLTEAVSSPLHSRLYINCYKGENNFLW